MPRGTTERLLLVFLVSGYVLQARAATLGPPLCSFNRATRTYNASDLLLCMSSLAADAAAPQQHKSNSNEMMDRADYEGNQLLLPSYAPDFSSSYFNQASLTSLLSGLLPAGLPNLSSLLNFNGLTRPNFNLFRALSSIAQYDDLKCVPRILCEVASGSSPGNLDYRQGGPGGNSIQDFGTNALFSLLTAFDSRGTSPLISFGKAALIGYANRGQAGMCFREYSRCPRDPDQLISYLNNHNGGFFQLFNGQSGGYYGSQNNHYYHHQQQPYYKNSESRIVGSKSQYAPAQPYLGPEADRTGTGKLSFSNSEYYSQGKRNEYVVQSRITVGSRDEYASAQPYMGPEADRTGTGKLTFSNSEYYSQDESGEDSFTPEMREVESSKIKFPVDQRGSQSQLANQQKSQPIFSDLSGNDLRRDRFRKDRQFFPQNHPQFDVNDHSQQNFNRKPRLEPLRERQNYVHFPQ